MPYVYLCGPITGLDQQGATTWRKEVQQSLSPDIQCIDPTRDSPDYVRQSENADRTNSLERFLHGKETLTRDRMDIQKCDIVLAYFLGVKHISIGSIGEIFWADAYRRPVIIVREEYGNPHDHDMINAIACCIYTSIDPAIDKIRMFLTSRTL